MPEVFWISLFSALPPTLIALATLIAVIKGNVQITNLKDVVNGRLSEMIQVVKSSSKVEGKLEILENALPKNTTTTVITDRRTTSHD